MPFRIDHFQVELSRKIQAALGIENSLAFVEDGEFLEEFTACGLDDDDLEKIQCAITASPMAGDVVPVSSHIRDAFYSKNSSESAVIRYVYLQPPASTILLITAYPGDESLSMTADEAREAEEYIARQFRFFSTRYTT